jgi:hypothetical protein
MPDGALTWFERSLKRECMPSWTRRSNHVLVALTLLVGLGALWLVEPYVHTDDGCAFETHCITCQRTLGSIGVVTTRVLPSPTLDVLGDVTPRPVAVASQAPPDTQASRGPPQA